MAAAIVQPDSMEKEQRIERRTEAWVRVGEKKREDVQNLKGKQKFVVEGDRRPPRKQEHREK